MIKWSGDFRGARDPLPRAQHRAARGRGHVHVDDRPVAAKVLEQHVRHHLEEYGEEVSSRRNRLLTTLFDTLRIDVGRMRHGASGGSLNWLGTDYAFEHN